MNFRNYVDIDKYVLSYPAELLSTFYITVILLWDGWKGNCLDETDGREGAELQPLK